MIDPEDQNVVEALTIALSDEQRADPLASFPADPTIASHAGHYSWWADDAARSIIGARLGVPIPRLIYAGQADATRWPSGTTSKATLGSRIRGNHIGGNASSSTFRRHCRDSCSNLWISSWPIRGAFNAKTTEGSLTG